MIEQELAILKAQIYELVGDEKVRVDMHGNIAWDKLGLLGQSGSLGVDLSKLETIEDDWELGFKEVSFLGRGFSSPKVEKVRILQKSQENGQNRTNTDTGTEEHAKSHGNDIKSGQPSRKNVTQYAIIIGQALMKNHTWIMKEAQGMMGFVLYTLTKEAQWLLTHGCHVGNPCAIQSNPTALSDDPMIEGIYGQD
ncbi:hypothetical protein Tco_1393542 [Tanacetum coccineum]